MFKIPARDRVWEIDTPQIMGIMNATQDSFFEASRVEFVDTAVKKAGTFITNGASIIDIGGQSTRPGAQFISAQEEIQNIVPIIESIHAKYPSVLLSVDTFQSKVAEAALQAGAHIVNDISCGAFDKEILKVVTSHNAGYIGMHLTGDKNTMHQVPTRTHIVTEVIQYFEQKKKDLSLQGIENWVLDPGFGFGKTIQENFELVKSLKQFSTLALPILLGVSRKSSIYKTLGIDANEALNGTTVVNTVGLLNGANILRVHDVNEAQQIIKLLSYLA